MSRFGHTTVVPTGPFRFVAIDVETAGKTIGSICQIGLCCVGFDATLHSFSTMVDPEGRFEPFNTDLHGIGPDTVKGAPTFPDAFATLFPLLSAHPLVQHSRYDERAMDAACLRYGLPRLTSYWADSVKIARAAWPELKGSGGGHGLGNLKRALGLDFHHHDAGEDAKAAAQVVLRAEHVIGKQTSGLQTNRQLSFDLTNPAQ